MVRGARWLGLIGAVVLVWPVFAADDPKTDKKKDPPKEKLIPFKTIKGVAIKNVNSDRKSIGIQAGKDSVEVLGADDLKVRYRNPPPAFDDKGNFKKYTPKELAEMRSDKLEGYPADFSALKAGQVATVTLMKKPAAAAKKLEKGDNGLRVTFIVIERDPENK